MSSSFLNRKRWAVLGGVLLAQGFLVQALAQDAYFIPELELRAEHHTNLELDNGPTQGDESTEGYFANVGATLGLRGERGALELRPRFELQEYPDRDDLGRNNGYLDLRGNYGSQLSRFDLVGSYRRQDQIRSQLVEAEYDDFDPEDPVLDATGQILLLSETQTRVQVRPEFVHRFSERMGVGVNGLFQTVKFDADNGIARTDYDYMESDGYLLWGLGARTELLTGVYASRYETEDELNRTDGRGISLDLEHRWSETFTGTAELMVERTEVDLPGSTDDEESDNWGLNFGAVRTGQVSQWRFDLGRSFSPTAASRAEVDQVRVQYRRDITQRWQFTSAVRAFRRRAQGVDLSSNDRDYARGELGIRWNMSPTWYVGGGYSYVWQKYEDEADNRNDQIFTLRLGYRGLAPQSAARR